MAKIGCLKPFRGSYSSLSNVILEDGEIAFETTNKRIYMGNGSDIVSNLTPFINNGNTDISSIGDGSITGAINTINGKIEMMNLTNYAGTWCYNYTYTNAMFFVYCTVTRQIQLSNIGGGVIVVSSYGTVPVTDVTAFRNGVLLITDESYDTMKNLWAWVTFIGL